jgi:hypothetical protein
MGYSLGQWAMPWLVGRLFDIRHSYDLGWKMIAVLAIIGAGAIYVIPFFAAPRPSAR